MILEEIYSKTDFLDEQQDSEMFSKTTVQDDVQVVVEHNLKSDANTYTSLSSPRCCSQYSSTATLNASAEFEPAGNLPPPAEGRKRSLWRSSHFSTISISDLLLVILLIAIALASIVIHTKTSQSRSLHHQHLSPAASASISINESEEHPCGHNANAAREAGCIFDPLTFAWLAPACYDWDLTSEFLALQNWEYYRPQHGDDGSPRRRLSLINIMQGSDEVVYVSWEYHRQHCAYLWLKMHRAMRERRPIDGVSMLGIITDVCLGVARSEREGNDTSVPGYIRFPSCKMY